MSRHELSRVHASVMAYTFACRAGVSDGAKRSPSSRVERGLSAILAADMAGYSLPMHNREAVTHARWPRSSPMV